MMAITALSPNKYTSLQPTNQQMGYAFNSSGGTDNPYTPGHWSQSYVIRIVLGLLVAGGLTFMLIRLTELLLISFVSLDQIWKSVAGFICWQVVEVFGVFLGAMMAAAGRNQMMTLGVLLGIMAGFITLALVPTNPNITPMLYFAMPVWFTVAGALGAWVGESLWHPQYRKNIRILSNHNLTNDQADVTFSQMLRQAILGMIFAHIHWVKVVLAVLAILLSLWYAHDFLNWILLKFGLTLWVAEVGLQKAWVETMMKITVVVLASAMAGAGTTHGIAHGFWTGVISGVLNLLLRVFIPSEDHLPVNDILWEVGWCFMLCVVSGGFGALVLPPIMYLAQKRHPASLR